MTTLQTPYRRSRLHQGGTADQILQLLEFGDTWTADNLVDRLHRNRNTIDRALHRLANRGLVVRTGTATWKAT